jgi:hypothetical protein
MYKQKNIINLNLTIILTTFKLNAAKLIRMVLFDNSLLKTN